MNPIVFSTPPRRILIIKPSAIGDVVHALPVLNLLRARWPSSQVSWLVTPACAGLLEGHPQLDEVIRFERKQYGKAWRSPSAAMALLRFTRALRGRQFDLTIDLQGLFRSGWLAAMTRAPMRVGLAAAREFGWIYYTHKVPEGHRERHAVELNLDIAEALGLGRGPVKFVFPTTDEDRAHVAELVGAAGRYAVFLPGANWETKRWPPEKFAACVRPLRERFGLESIVAGGPDDAALAARIPGARDLTGKTNLRQLVALLERAALVIANDTGPMHIAAALGRPLVSMYGPTNPTLTGPFERLGSVVQLEIPCRPCYGRHCSHKSCLQKLEHDPILELAVQQLSGSTGCARNAPLRVLQSRPV